MLVFSPTVKAAISKPPSTTQSPLDGGPQIRNRTIITERQVEILKACYLINAFPDNEQKRQLVEMTGLSRKVVTVWFQNRRQLDKKKQMTTSPSPQKPLAPPPQHQLHQQLQNLQQQLQQIQQPKPQVQPHDLKIPKQFYGEF